MDRFLRIITKSVAIVAAGLALQAYLRKEPARILGGVEKEQKEKNEQKEKAQASSSRASEELDLSSVTFEGKPPRYCKRVLAETKQLLSAEGLAQAEDSGCNFSLRDKESLSKWLVQLRNLNPEGKLAKALKKFNLEPCIDLEFILPDTFPMSPPFVRLVYPELQGPFVFTSGAICFELLTEKGWPSGMQLQAVAMSIQGFLDQAAVTVKGVGNRKTRTVKNYTEEGARKGHSQIASWHRNGDESTYSSQKLAS